MKVDWKEEMKDSDHEYTDEFLLDEVKKLKARLDEMEKHYGYSIKEQVYYSVSFPLNEMDGFTGKPYAGYGRNLNDNVLQQLLLAFPEIYEPVPFESTGKKGIFE